MEKAVNIKLVKYLEENNIISDKQYGFRSKRSTGDLLAYVSHVWNTTLEKYGESRVVALDISKAFDQVWHKGLLGKLPSYGLPNEFCHWMGSFLEGRSLHVVVDGVSSDTLPINAGVPQGSILSPTLFLIFINDLLKLTRNPIYSFADDSTLLASFSSDKPLSAATSARLAQEQVSSINSDLDTITDWGTNNLVKFNASKTQTTVFSKKKSSTDHSPLIRMSGQNLTMNPSVSLLGITASANLSWHDHVSSIAKVASQKLGFLFRAKHFFTSEQLLLLYKAQIRPCMEYCSHIWSDAPKQSLALLDAVQKRAIKMINNPTLTDSLQSLEHRRKVADLSLFYRYYHGICSEDLANLIPPRATRVRSTRSSQASHPYLLQLTTPRTSKYKASFWWRTAHLWNSLPASSFPQRYNLDAFKRRVNRHLLSSAHSTV